MSALSREHGFIPLGLIPYAGIAVVAVIAGIWILGLKGQLALQKIELAEQKAAITTLQSKNAELAHGLTEKNQAIEVWADEYAKYKKAAEAERARQNARAASLKNQAAEWEMLATREIPKTPDEECRIMREDLDKFILQQRSLSP